MIQVDRAVNLRPYNTFGISATADYFYNLHKAEDFQALIQSGIYRKNSVLIVGGGSNILLTSDFHGLIVRNTIKGIAVLNDTNGVVRMKVASGENWHDLVMHCVQHNYGGIENLALIPGTVGAAPMQNIGAYGVEIQHVVEQVDVVDRNTGIQRSLTSAECRFGYRESVFKHELKEKYFISSVTLRLTSKEHQLNTAYGAIQETLQKMNVTKATIADVARAVIAIRTSKLPDPKEIGNAGSFFKNPSVTNDVYNTLKAAYPAMPGYIGENQYVKIPAAWLIEQCGWKGKRINDVGVHQHQALVLVNYGNGKGNEILQLAKNIQRSVKEKFNIELTPEVNII